MTVMADDDGEDPEATWDDLGVDRDGGGGLGGGGKVLGGWGG